MLIALALVSGLLALVFLLWPSRRDAPIIGPVTGPDVGPDAAQLARLRRDAAALAARGAVFAVTEADHVPGCDLVALGEVWLTRPEGQSPEGALKAKAAARFPGTRVLTRLSRRDVAKGVEWRATACSATPQDPALRPTTARMAPILIDASNVVMWEVNAGLATSPSLRPLIAVLDVLAAEGRPMHVVCDASFGHRLEGRFWTAAEVARRLGNRRGLDVTVVDKGQVADRWLIAASLHVGGEIVTNDLFRDHPEARFVPKRRGWAAGGQAEVLAAAM